MKIRISKLKMSKICRNGKLRIIRNLEKLENLKFNYLYMENFFVISVTYIIK